MIGIEKLKKDLVVIAKIVLKLDKALEDDKISITEGIGLAFEVPALFKLVKGYKESWEELQDLDEAEALELSEHFAEEFSLSNAKAEEVVESILEVVLALVVVFINVEEV